MTKIETLAEKEVLHPGKIREKITKKIIVLEGEIILTTEIRTVLITETEVILTTGLLTKDKAETILLTEIIIIEIVLIAETGKITKTLSFREITEIGVNLKKENLITTVLIIKTRIRDRDLHLPGAEIILVTNPEAEINPYNPENITRK